jgi:hypothetical protein
MELTIKINMDNEAFCDCQGEELARILGNIAEDMEGCSWDEDQTEKASILDFNGNKVGFWAIY